MNKAVDFYYDYISPASYLAWTQLPEICTNLGATLNYKPILLGGVLKDAGNKSPATVPAKYAWIKKDFARYADLYGVPFDFNPHFIFSTVSVMRGALWAVDEGRIEDFNQAMFKAAWADGKDLSDNDVIAEVLQSAGFDVDAFIQAITLAETKQRLISATKAASAAGVFGAPTMVIGDELHFGQDRLDWVERALRNT